MSGGWRRSAVRSLAGVSPERTPTAGVCSVSPRRSAAARMPAMGARRFFSTSTARALIGERYRTRVRSVFSGTGSVTRRSIAQRKAARVLPEPVGARISVWSPAAIAGQPLVWASVGAPNVVSNHSRTAGEKGPSGSATPARYPRGVTVTPGVPRGSPWAHRVDDRTHRVPARREPGAAEGPDGAPAGRRGRDLRDRRRADLRQQRERRLRRLRGPRRHRAPDRTGARAGVRVRGHHLRPQRGPAPTDRRREAV